MNDEARVTKSVRPSAGRLVRHSAFAIRHSRRRRAAFTLVATLLLTFLIISLLVALMSVVLVETRVVRNQMKQMRARSFAMNGVYAALNRLHDYNGLDWRATATAGLMDSDPATPEIEGVENPWLSGIWQGRGLSSAEQKEKPIVWLTSGALSYPSRAPELNVSKDPAPASDDKQEPVTPQTKLPDPGPGEDTIWLLRKPVGEDPKLSVKARMIPFKTSRPTRTADPDKTYVIGHYAWWAADEGVKARLNLPLPEHDPAQPAAVDDAQTLAQWRLAAPQRANMLMTGFENLPSGQENLHKVLTFAQIPLLAGGDGGALIPALEKRWHDVTANSHSLITNSRDGGVKFDLSMLFEMDDEERRQFEPGMANSLASLLDYYQTWKNVRARDTRPALDAQPFAIKPADDSKQALAVAANTWLNTVSAAKGSEAHKCLFSPVVVRMSHAFSVQAKPVPPREFEGPDRKLTLVLDPLVTLWNPYNIILELDAFRIDAWLPSVHLVVEKRDPWKQQRFYQQGDEVWHNAKLYRAAEASIAAEPGSEPDPDAPRWQPLARDWSLATDLEPSEVLVNHGSGGRPRLLLLQSKDNPQTRLSLKPGEMLTFSLNSGQVATHTSGHVNLTLEPGWNAEGGISFDRLADDRHPLRTPDQLLRLYADSELRITLEPARDAGYAAADPFAFVANHAAEGLAPQDVTLTPQAWRESIGYRNGGGGSLEDYAWAGTRTGRGPEFSHRVRAYSGQEDGKPLPGMSPVLKLGQDITPDAKKFLGVIDWHMKSAENADFPAAMIAHFDPRAVIVRHPGSGYPATLPHYQIKARRIASGDEVPGTINPLTGGLSTHAPLFEVPTAPLVSMGQLQHYPWVGEAPWLTGFSAYSLGNSWASPWVSPSTGGSDSRFDVSFQVNSIFDQFFFSSITPRKGENSVRGRLADFLDSKLSRPLPNPRMKFLLDYGQGRKDLLAALMRPLDKEKNPIPAFRRVAASLLVEGGFNVNSTSVEAWKALLGSLRGVKMPAFDAGGLGVSMAGSFGSPLPRFTLVNGPSNTPQDWRGYRSLTSAEIEALAIEIVREVKTRGPFTSLSDFINRRLTDDETGKKGALQAAIDRSGINRAFESPQITRQQLDDATALGTAAGMDWSFPFPDHLVGPVAAATPGFLTQADVLQALAPHLVTRSDTYKIRAYGDVVDPLSGRLEARAWVEVFVQRMPEYVNYPNKDEPPEERRADPDWQQTNALHNVSNRVYGRRWRVVRVRWLSAEEV